MNIYLKSFYWTILLLFLKTVAALKCHQCDSNEDIYCAELFNLDKIDIEPSSCDDVYESKFCIKATGMYQGTIGTRRFCSSRHHGNYCEYVKRPGDDREYRSCIFTCYNDGCNTGSGKTASVISIIILITSLMLLRYI